jgi:hypothetical protein
VPNISPFANVQNFYFPHPVSFHLINPIPLPMGKYLVPQRVRHIRRVLEAVLAHIQPTGLEASVIKELGWVTRRVPGRDQLFAEDDRGYFLRDDARCCATGLIGGGG